MPEIQIGELNSKRLTFYGILPAKTARKLLRIARVAARYRSHAVGHAELVNIALAGEEILHANSLATVTPNFIVVQRPEPQIEVIIGLGRISKIKHIHISRPGYLVIAGGSYLLSAAAACSKQGGHASFPLAVLGSIFAVAYLMSRRGTVAFVLDRETTETRPGSVTEAAELVEAMLKILAPRHRRSRLH